MEYFFVTNLKYFTLQSVKTSLILTFSKKIFYTCKRYRSFLKYTLYIMCIISSLILTFKKKDLDICIFFSLKGRLKPSRFFLLIKIYRSFFDTLQIFKFFIPVEVKNIYIFYVLSGNYAIIHRIFVI